MICPGMDVARKLIILAREMGLTLEMSDVESKAWCRRHSTECSVEEFMARLAGVRRRHGGNAR